MHGDFAAMREMLELDTLNIWSTVHGSAGVTNEECFDNLDQIDQRAEACGTTRDAADGNRALRQDLIGLFDPVFAVLGPKPSSRETFLALFNVGFAAADSSWRPAAVGRCMPDEPEIEAPGSSRSARVLTDRHPLSNDQ